MNFESYYGLLSLEFLPLEEYPWLAALLGLTVLSVIAWVANFFTHRVLLRGLHAFASRFAGGIGGAFVRRRVIGRLTSIVPALVVHAGVEVVPYLPPLAVSAIQVLVQAFVILRLAQALAAFLDVLDDIYQDRKSTRLNSSHVRISYAVFCLKKKKKKKKLYQSGQNTTLYHHHN